MKLDSQSKIKGDIGGTISLSFIEGSSFTDFCMQHIAGYNPDRLEAFALRVFYGKEISVTVYAKDNYKSDDDNFDKDKMPVKKFKLDKTALHHLFNITGECNFTLSTGNYPLEDMEVINR